MARAAKPTKAKQPPAQARKPTRPKTAPATPTTKVTKPAAAPKRVPAAAPTTPIAAKVSKDELRAQVEKLERANATLRAKSRETNKSAKAAAIRIAELEEQVAQFEKQAALQSAAAKKDKKPVKPTGAKRQSRGVDPGDAVPPGVAVQEPEPLDNEAETALENLEEHLGHE